MVGDEIMEDLESWSEEFSHQLRPFRLLRMTQKWSFLVIIFGVIHEKDWRQESQLRSSCSNSFLTELVISKVAKGPHPRDI